MAGDGICPSSPCLTLYGMWKGHNCSATSHGQTEEGTHAGEQLISNGFWVAIVTANCKWADAWLVAGGGMVRRTVGRICHSGGGRLGRSAAGRLLGTGASPRKGTGWGSENPAPHSAGALMLLPCSLRGMQDAKKQDTSLPAAELAQVSSGGGPCTVLTGEETL